MTRWWDRWLRGEKNEIEAGPPITIFVQGAGVWRHEQRSGRLDVRIEAFERQPPRVRAEANEEAERLAAFLGTRLGKLKCC